MDGVAMSVGAMNAVLLHIQVIRRSTGQPYKIVNHLQQIYAILNSQLHPITIDPAAGSIDPAPGFINPMTGTLNPASAPMGSINPATGFINPIAGSIDPAINSIGPAWVGTL